MNDDRCVMNTYMPIIFTKKKYKIDLEILKYCSII